MTTKLLFFVTFLCMAEEGLNKLQPDADPKVAKQPASDITDAPGVTDRPPAMPEKDETCLLLQPDSLASKYKDELCSDKKAQYGNEICSQSMQLFQTMCVYTPPSQESLQTLVSTWDDQLKNGIDQFNCTTLEEQILDFEGMKSSFLTDEAECTYFCIKFTRMCHIFSNLLTSAQVLATNNPLIALDPKCKHFPPADMMTVLKKNCYHGLGEPFIKDSCDVIVELSKEVCADLTKHEELLKGLSSIKLDACIKDETFNCDSWRKNVLTLTVKTDMSVITKLTKCPFNCKADGERDLCCSLSSMIHTAKQARRLIKTADKFSVALQSLNPGSRFFPADMMANLRRDCYTNRGRFVDESCSEIIKLLISLNKLHVDPVKDVKFIKIVTDLEKQKCENTTVVCSYILSQVKTGPETAMTAANCNASCTSDHQMDLCCALNKAISVTFQAQEKDGPLYMLDTECKYFPPDDMMKALKIPCSHYDADRFIKISCELIVELSMELCANMTKYEQLLKGLTQFSADSGRCKTDKNFDCTTLSRDISTVIANTDTSIISSADRCVFSCDPIVSQELCCSLSYTIHMANKSRGLIRAADKFTMVLQSLNPTCPFYSDHMMASLKQNCYTNKGPFADDSCEWILDIVSQLCTLDPVVDAKFIKSVTEAEQFYIKNCETSTDLCDNMLPNQALPKDTAMTAENCNASCTSDHVLCCMLKYNIFVAQKRRPADQGTPTAAPGPGTPAVAPGPDTPTAARDPDTQTATRDPGTPAVAPGPDTPTAARDPDTPIAAHDPDTPTAARDPDTPIAAHDPDTPIAAHDPDTPTAARDPDTPTAAHDPDTPTAAHDPDTPTAAHDPYTPTAAHDPDTPAVAPGPEKTDKTVVDLSAGSSTSHFMAYFLTACILCIAGYVVFYNRKKVLAFFIESKPGRSHAHDYKPLKTSVEEAMPSMDKPVTMKNYIY